MGEAEIDKVWRDGNQSAGEPVKQQRVGEDGLNRFQRARAKKAAVKVERQPLMDEIVTRHGLRHDAAGRVSWTAEADPGEITQSEGSTVDWLATA